MSTLKENKAAPQQNLLVKKEKGGARIKIISPTAQATEQAQASAKEGNFGDSLLVTTHRPIKKRKQSTPLTKTIKKSSDKKKKTTKKKKA